MADLSLVPTTKTYREMLKTAARISDKAKSVELFFIFILGARRTLRAGELLHFNPEWYDSERKVIQIPEFENCNCSLCSYYAEIKKNNGDPRHEQQILEDDYWSPKSDAGARTIPLKTEREIEIVEKFIDIHGSLDYTYSTLRNRVIRLAELCESTNAKNWSPHLLRATSVTHLLWSDFGHMPMKTLAGWGDHEYGEEYIQATGYRVDQAFDRMWSEDGSGVKVRSDPPRWSDLRPKFESSELIYVERWTPKTSGNSNSRRFRDSEEMYLDNEDPLEEYRDNLSKFSSATPTSAFITVVQQRWKVEREAAYYTDDVLDPDIENVATLGIAITLGAVGIAILSSWSPGISPSLAAGVMLGAVARIRQTDLDHPDY